MILSRYKAMYKLHLKKFMRDRGYTAENMKNDKSIEVPPLKIKTGLFKTEVITLE